MRKWLIIGGALLFVVVAGALVAKRMAAWLPGYVRDRVVSTLRQNFASEVDLPIFRFPYIRRSHFVAAVWSCGCTATRTFRP